MKAWLVAAATAAIVGLAAAAAMVALVTQTARAHPVKLIPPLVVTATPTPVSRELFRPAIVAASPTPSAPVLAPVPLAAMGLPNTITAAPTLGSARPQPRAGPSAIQWARLRMCESRNNYADKYNLRYRGAYQIGFSEWANYGGYHDPADAPPPLQDARALQIWQARGWQPWTCAPSVGPR